MKLDAKIFKFKKHQDFNILVTQKSNPDLDMFTTEEPVSLRDIFSDPEKAANSGLLQAQGLDDNGNQRSLLFEIKK